MDPINRGKNLSGRKRTSWELRISQELVMDYVKVRRWAAIFVGSVKDIWFLTHFKLWWKNILEYSTMFYEQEAGRYALMHGFGDGNARAAERLNGERNIQKYLLVHVIFFFVLLIPIFTKMALEEITNIVRGSYWWLVRKPCVKMCWMLCCVRYWSYWTKSRCFWLWS